MNYASIKANLISIQVLVAQLDGCLAEIRAKPPLSPGESVVLDQCIDISRNILGEATDGVQEIGSVTVVSRK